MLRPVRTAVLAMILLGTTASPAMAEGPAAPAADPSPNTYPIVLSGDFTGDGVGDLFFFSPSSAPDVLYEFNPEGGPDANSIDIYTYAVTGSYRPFVGHFGDDSRTDDIFWYRPGAAADVIWDFTECIPCTARPEFQRLPITVNGTYRPVAGEFRPGGADRSDIIWYGPGKAADVLWDFSAPCDRCQSTRTQRSLTINGAGYLPVAGNFVGPLGGAEDVFWYNPNGTETMWSFGWSNLAGYHSISSPSLQVRAAGYKLAVAELFGDQTDDIIFVGPGGAQDSVWDFFDDSIYKRPAPESLTGAYTAVSGVRQQDFEVLEDFFVYDPAATAGRYYDIYSISGDLFYDRYDFDPAPLTELPPVEPVAGAAAAAPEARRWHTPRSASG